MRVLPIFILLFFSFSFGIERTKYIMGTYISINLPKQYKDFFKPTFDIFKYVDRKFSKYNPKSYVYKLNKEKKAKLDKTFKKLLDISLKIYRETNGYFDITLGNITKKYGSFFQKTETYTKSINTTGIKNIVVKDGYIYLKNDISLDFGGIGKGYSVDLASNFLEKNGVKNAIIKASGEIRCFDICEIFIRNPFGEGFIASFKTKMFNASISTSGDYEKFIKTKENNHLINPKNKKPQKIFSSITLIGQKNNTYIDAYATAVSVMPLKKALRFLSKKNLAFIIIKKDGTIIKSKNLNQFIENLVFYVPEKQNNHRRK